ncbi:MAG: ribose 5-phosphate isomerase B [Ignavibacteriae bacterium]|nr:ribose 5-phosphate isomerase B [Ignavibacteriota bacterium]
MSGSRPLVTERDVYSLLASGGKRLEVLPGSVITSLAKDTAVLHGVQIIESPSLKESALSTPTNLESPQPNADAFSKRTVVFGSDHGGYQLKEILKKHAMDLGFQIVDIGTSNEEPCDYPDFAYAVARTVSSGNAWRGVMIDGAGIGSCVVANKVPGIRAACCHNEFVARNSREHNDTNVLTLGSRVTGSEVCKEILKVWLETWFSGGRHKKRVDKISEVENRLWK